MPRISNVSQDLARGKTVIRLVRMTLSVVALTAVLGTLLISTAAAGGTVVADLEITDVEFTARGAVKVTMSYVCPSGYSPAEEEDASASLEQFVDDVQLQRYKRSPGVSFTCDGTSNELTVKFRNAASGEPFHPDVPLFVGAGFFVTNGEGEIVAAGDSETVLEGRVLADLEIQGFELTRTGAAKVTVAYRCPEGYTVDDSIAEVFVPGESGQEFKHFQRKLDCDGSRNELSIRFKTTGSGDPLEPGMQYVVSLSLDPVAITSMRATNKETLILNA